MPNPSQNGLKSVEDAFREEEDKYLWVCPYCQRLHYPYEEECQCQGRLYPSRIERNIASSYVCEPL